MATEYRTPTPLNTEKPTGNCLFDHLIHVASKLGLRDHLAALANDLMGRDDEDTWAAGVAAAYNFSRARTIVDVGGGTGTLMTAILQRHPGTTGIIFDAAAVLSGTGEYLLASGVSDRCRTVAGDIFRNPLPTEGDIYILSNVLCDWEDSRAQQILNACSAAMAPESRLLVMERLMPHQQSETAATVAAGVTMARLLCCQKRTEAEYRRMLAKARLQVRSLQTFAVTGTVGTSVGTIIESRLQQRQVTCTADIDDCPQAGFLVPLCLGPAEYGYAVS